MNGIDIAATQTKIDAFKTANKDLIQRNKNKPTQEQQELEEELKRDELAMKKKAEQRATAEKEEIRKNREANEKLIDLLLDASTEDIVASPKQSVAAQEQYVLFIPCFLIYVSTTS